MAASLDPTQRAYVNLHRAAIRALLALEARAKKALAATLRREVAVAREDVISAVEATAGDRARAAAAIGAARRASASLAAGVTQAVLDVRAEARAFGHREATRQLRAVVRMAQRDGYEVSPQVTAYLHNAEQAALAKVPRHWVQLGGSTVAQHGATVDETIAGLAGSSVARGFERDTLASALSWESTGLVPKDLTAWIQTTRARVEREAANLAVSQTAHAYEDQTEREIHDFFTNTITDTDEWVGNTVKVWSATLDRVTCSRCWGMDGQMIPATESFSPGPGDVHIHCRCDELTVYVPDHKKQALAGIMSDYGRFKGDVAATGGAEHYPAMPYIKDALDTTSPQALTRKLAERQARGL